MKKTQTSEILRYLKSHKKGITPKLAEDMFGTMRLGSIIHNLRRQGHEIETIDEYTKTRYGTTTRYARYILHG